MKVLLVEDSRNYAFLVETMLETSVPEDLSIIWADNLAKALERLHQDRPDVILLDLSLPDSDGLATLARVQPAAGEIPIVVLTGYADEALAVEALRCGAQDYLVKSDIEKRGLLRAVRYAIERKNSEEKFRDLVESIDAIVWEADPATCRFTFVSKAAEKILGYPIGCWLEDFSFSLNLIHPDDRSSVVGYRRSACDEGKNYEVEFRVIAAHGGLVWLRDHARVITDAAGKPSCLRGVMVDITPSKQAEAARQEREHEIQSIHEISREVLAADNVGSALDTILELSMALGGYDVGAIRLLNSNRQLDQVYYRGYENPEAIRMLKDPTAPEGKHRWSARLAGVLAARETHVHEDTQSRDGVQGFKKEGIRSAIVVPIATQNKVFGVLQVGTRNLTKFQPEQIKLLEILGDQIGLVVQKAHLHEETKRSLERIQALHELNVAATSTLDLRIILDLLLEKIEHFLPCVAASVLRVLDRSTGTFEATAYRNLDDLLPGGGGLSRIVMEQKAPVMIVDGRADPRIRYPDFWRRHGFVSYLAVPLIDKNQVLGYIGTFTKVAHVFSREDVDLLTSLAAQAAIAIYNARSYEEAKNAVKKATVLRQIDLAITSSLDLDTQIKILLDNIAQIFPTYAITLRLANAETEVFEGLACRGLDEDDWRNTTPDNVNSGHGEVVRLRRAVKIVDAQNDPRIRHHEFFKRNGLVSYLGVPLVFQEEILGVLGYFAKERHDFKDDEIEFMSTLAEHVAIAIHNARLYAAVDKQSQELAALLDVSTATSQSLEMDRALDQALHRINDIFCFDATRFFIVDSMKHELVHRASHTNHAAMLPWSRSFAKGKGITGRVAATGEAIIITDTLADQRYTELTLTNANRQHGQRFLAGFPAKYQGETLGVVMCIGRNPRQLTIHEIELIESMSSQIAVAVANARLYEQTKDQAEQLRNLAAHLESVREDERREISREIHDELGQTLTALKFDVSWIRGKLSKDQPLRNRLSEMSVSLDGAIQSTREISARLRPDILDKFGLTAAIEWQLHEFRKRTGIQYHFACDPADLQLDERQSTALFRIFQEALTNVARHSRASRVRIDLQLQEGTIFLRVDDDGGGIREDKVFDAQSLALLGMRERAAVLGGSVSVERNRVRGTTVTAQLPAEHSTENGASLERREL